MACNLGCDELALRTEADVRPLPESVGVNKDASPTGARQRDLAERTIVEVIDKGMSIIIQYERGFADRLAQADLQALRARMGASDFETAETMSEVPVAVLEQAEVEGGQECLASVCGRNGNTRRTS